MLPQAIFAALLGATLLAAAALKVADRTAAAVGAGSFGLRGRAARAAWLPLAALEAGLAAGVLAGSTAATWAAAAALTGFALAQALAIAAGRGGAPCGCFGARERISWGSAARAGLLAGAAALLAERGGAPAGAPQLAAALTALAVATTVVVRARRPAGALDIAGEGPPLGTRLNLGEDIRLALFTAQGCRLCGALVPRAQRLGANIFDQAAHSHAWSLANVPGAPFAVALAADGTVLAKGTVNTPRQLASVANAARTTARAGAVHPQHSSRRGFLQTASAAVAVLTAGRVAGSLVAPGDAEAFHFCGHVFTTDGCPHPTGLPRIDRHGYPLRAKDGKPVDDLGRPVNANGAPVDDAGAPLLDPDGRPQPPARRRRICTAAGKRYKIAVRTDGAWYRCCDGHVRKLLDCCTTGQRRINGDRALKGYCYADRRVFCVMYYQTNVPC